MGARDNPNGGGDYELGDLDLDLSPAPPRPASVPKAPAAPQAATAAKSSRGGADDLDLSGFGGGAEGPLELASSSNDNWRGSIDHLVGGDADEDPLHAPGALPAVELDAVPRRSGRLSGTRAEREADALQNDPRRKARELAGFGPDPSGLGCVPYIAKVVVRRAQLSAERRQLARTQKELSSRLDEALLELGRALSALAPEQLTRVKPALDAVLMARGAAEAADQNAAEARRQTEARIREIDAEIVDLKRELEPFVLAEAQARAAFDQADNLRKRAQALLNRVDIERRAIETAEGQVDEAREQALATQRSQREAELAQAQAATDQAQAAHAQTKRELDEKQRVVDDLSLSRRRLADQADKERRKLENAAQGAEGELTQRLRDLGRAANDARLDELGGDRARRVRDLDKQYGLAVEQKQLFDLARKSYDKGALMRGVGLIVGALGAGAAALHFL